MTWNEDSGALHHELRVFCVGDVSVGKGHRSSKRSAAVWASILNPGRGNRRRRKSNRPGTVETSSLRGRFPEFRWLKVFVVRGRLEGLGEQCRLGEVGTMRQASLLSAGVAWLKILCSQLFCMIYLIEKGIDVVELQSREGPTCAL